MSQQGSSSSEGETNPAFTPSDEESEEPSTSPPTIAAQTDLADIVVDQSTATRRRPLNQDEFFSRYEHVEKPKRGLVEKAKNAAQHAAEEKIETCCSVRGWKSFMFGIMPILSWLPKYSLKKNVVGDTISGITVAVMHIPQGMAYALLAGMPAVNGLYMAFFPVLVYIVFCTSRHNSMGSFAIVLLMTGTLADQVLDKYGRVEEKQFISSSSNYYLVQSRAMRNETTGEPSGGYTGTQAVTVISLAVGIWQIAMGVLRLGSFSVLLSDVLVSGFTTGSAIHVLTSQLKNIFGLPVPKENRFPKLLRSHWFVIQNIFDSNAAALVVSAAAMAILAINNDHLKPRLAKKCRIPVPIELIVVVVGTATSYFLDLHEKHSLTTIGSLPTGLPPPEVPQFAILSDVLGGAVVIAIVAYTTSYSMARILALKQNYEVDANQELLAQGLGNVTGAFFRSGPIAASLSRSLIQQTVGGVTQMASVFSCLVLLVILLFIGPLFEPLPNCILSSIILVALKGMFMQFKDFLSAWKTSKLDAAIWMATFLSVVVIDIDIGLGIGVAVSLVTLILRGQRAYACILGELPGVEGVYVDVKRYAMAEEIHNVKIFHFGAGLHFANSDHFREVLFKLTGLDPVRWDEGAKKRLKRQLKSSGNELEMQQGIRSIFCCCSKGPQDNHEKNHEGWPQNGTMQPIPTLNGNLAPPGFGHLGDRKKSVHVDTTGLPLPFRYLLIDLSAVSFIDMAGTKLLKALVQDYDKINVIVVFAGASEPVVKMFRKVSFNVDVPPQYLFANINDAVVSSKWKCVPKKGSPVPEIAINGAPLDSKSSPINIDLKV